jgi:hypothetical protein
MVEWDSLPGSAAFQAPCSSTTVISGCKKCGYFSDRKPSDNDVAVAQIAAIFCGTLEKRELDGGERGTVIVAGQPSTRVSASDWT